MDCECCNIEFRNLIALTTHLQHKSNCYDFYINKYKEVDNFPWKITSDYKNKKIYKCLCCKKRCSQKTGISKHVLQHSKNCYEYYIKEFGKNRTKWPKESGLNKDVCIDCGLELKDIRSIYCPKCYYFNNNSMKIKEVIKKNIESNKIMRNSDKGKEWKNKISIKAKLRHKNRPELSQKQREYMLNGGAAIASAGIKNPSKPQVEIFEMIKNLGYNTKLNHPCLNYSIDIAIPDLKIAIEYDGSYWHQDKEKDRIRQENIEKEGWKVIRYVDYIPTLDELKNKLTKIE